MKSRYSVYGKKLEEARLEEQALKSSEMWICNVIFFGI